MGQTREERTIDEWNNMDDDDDHDDYMTVWDWL